MALEPCRAPVPGAGSRASWGRRGASVGAPALPMRLPPSAPSSVTQQLPLLPRQVQPVPQMLQPVYPYNQAEIIVSNTRRAAAGPFRFYAASMGSPVHRVAMGSPASQQHQVSPLAAAIRQSQAYRQSYIGTPLAVRGADTPLSTTGGGTPVSTRGNAKPLKATDSTTAAQIPSQVAPPRFGMLVESSPESAAG
uniref:Uncharacterized protein n=1 Tax=Alexandrium monilatum TaxID=311494 RepID=A0A7S4QH18_9DINO